MGGRAPGAPPPRSANEDLFLTSAVFHFSYKTENDEFFNKNNMITAQNNRFENNQCVLPSQSYYLN